MDTIYRKVVEISAKTTDDLVKKTLKLSEEVGELAAEVLKLDGFKRSKESKVKIKAHLIEEAVDSMLVIFDILATAGVTEDVIDKVANKKIKKWQRKHINIK
jgi:NTP pyrophosphatase (non-canonical NTP hydrolase)